MKNVIRGSVVAECVVEHWLDVDCGGNIRHMCQKVNSRESPRSLTKITGDGNLVVHSCIPDSWGFNLSGGRNHIKVFDEMGIPLT